MSKGDLTSNPVKRAIRRKIVEIFNDRERGEAPVVRSRNALLAPTSVAWRVHGDVASMMAGGIASLLLQMLHPGVLAGVWDHSNFRTDMHGRLRRTARFIATTTYADRSEAEAMIRHVRSVHDGVKGHLPDGAAYEANDPMLLAWVHVTETRSFLDAWIRYGEPWMSRGAQDRYFAEMAVIGRALGAEPLPRTRAEADRMIADMRPALRADARTAEVARLILRPVATSRLAAVPGKLAAQAGVDLLPPWAPALHGLSPSPLQAPLVRAGTLGVAQALRWAFR
ncbi:oxygenase MpaB family protein [Novosphingobium kaempferiae]|uniref:oxygenase MpaB family protein n=1 Tax=Novosphingobium kaempferiae TaxID=2896849 RepID=UPI001E400596|nr:oxygenase MpaB family protein [Novosphingobium kaempferiae]